MQGSAEETVIKMCEQVALLVIIVVVGSQEVLTSHAHTRGTHNSRNVSHCVNNASSRAESSLLQLLGSHVWPT